ncbi:hypothetical protein MBLNU459_g2316t1 [Dothideomycetes sp. NU459]
MSTPEPGRAFSDSSAQAEGSAKRPSQSSDHAIMKRGRGRTGCLNCRRRRKKCDETKPNCSKCIQLGETCEWDSGVTFRLHGIRHDHPSMRASNRRPSNHTFQIVDVTFDATTHRPKELINGKEIESVDHTHGNGLSLMRSLSTPDVEPLGERIDGSGADSSFGAIPTAHKSDLASDSVETRSLISIDQTMSPRSSGIVTVADRNRFPSSPYGYNSTAIGSGKSDDQPDSAGGSYYDNSTAAALGALDYLTSFGTDPSFLPSENSPGNPPMWQMQSSVPDMDQIMADSPDIYGTYYPNAQYKELHTTLHNHIVETARNTGATGQCTPEQQLTNSEPLIGSATAHNPASTSNTGEEALLLGPSAKGLSSRRELQLWRNYFDEVSVWLDMFDHERHFQHVLPLLANTSRPLRLSILALSARQIERKDPDKPYTESLALYQEAIQLIVQDLQSLDIAVIASCVLLCVLEMMSSSPRDWGRHLDGCAMLLEAAGINGSVGGMRQALFWCFARMDVWGGYLSDTFTKIPTSLWGIQSGSMSAAVSQFKTMSTSFYGYANYAVFLCASVLNVITNQDDVSIERAETGMQRRATYATRWKALFDLVQDWYNSRPPEMQPLMCAPASDDPLEDPFPLVLYGSSPAVNGNQLYHASTLLMLQEKPKDVKLKGQRSILWHARQICGISACNHNHGPWINALQPLWIAGKLMSHPAEHRVILDILKRIEKETGWATSWRARDLKEYWGEADP